MHTQKPPISFHLIFYFTPCFLNFIRPYVQPPSVLPSTSSTASPTVAPGSKSSRLEPTLVVLTYPMLTCSDTSMWSNCGHGALRKWQLGERRWGSFLVLKSMQMNRFFPPLLQVLSRASAAMKGGGTFLRTELLIYWEYNVGNDKNKCPWSLK